MCTAVIVSGNRAESGNPMLLKHRDMPYNIYGQRENSVVYCGCRRYGEKGILAVVDKGQSNGRVLCGMNADGFSIINTATYNKGIRNFNTQSVPSRLMYDALSTCRDKNDFDALLTSFHSRLMPANYGVTDRQGNAFYYEVSERDWKSIDVTKDESGCWTFTNYSISGDSDNKPGLERHKVAASIVDSYKDRKISVEMLMDGISRSFRNDLLNIDLMKTGSPFGEYFMDGYFIPLRSTTFSAVFEGNVIWISLGYPPLSVTIPVQLGRTIPDIPVQMFSEAKRKIFDINTGEGNRYFNFSMMYDGSRNGFMERIKNLEREMRRDFQPDSQDSTLKEFYKTYIDKIVALYTEFLEMGIERDRYSEYRLCEYGRKGDEVIARKRRFIISKIFNKL